MGELDDKEEPVSPTETLWGIPVYEVEGMKGAIIMSGEQVVPLPIEPEPEWCTFKYVYDCIVHKNTHNLPRCTLKHHISKV